MLDDKNRVGILSLNRLCEVYGLQDVADVFFLLPLPVIRVVDFPRGANILKQRPYWTIVE